MGQTPSVPVRYAKGRTNHGAHTHHKWCCPWRRGFGFAVLQSARLRFENLNFDKAIMEDAHLQGAQMWRTQMQGARLWEAQMQGAGLIGAQMQGADLRKTEFDAETDFLSADLSGAQIYSVDFSHTGISAKQLNSAFGDGSTTLPAGMARPAHWPQAELEIIDFLYEYHKWQENPATYAPPAP
ncbi:MAG: pentapeptide repeat-containing protein [Rhodobacteraceae bacterium]|nr:pentapeptide repeat-containing protein [Paracoccaceae bacterium]